MMLCTGRRQWQTDWSRLTTTSYTLYTAITLLNVKSGSHSQKLFQFFTWREIVNDDSGDLMLCFQSLSSAALLAMFFNVYKRLVYQLLLLFIMKSYMSTHVVYTLYDCGMNVYCNPAYGCQITINVYVNVYVYTC